VISRHHLRAKILQALYAYEQSEVKNLEIGWSNLKDLLDDFGRNYALMVMALRDTSEMSIDYSHELANKLLSENRIFENDNFSRNYFIETLGKNDEFQRFLKKQRWANTTLIEPGVARRWFMAFREQTPEYTEYSNIHTEPARAKEAELLMYLLVNIIVQDEQLDPIMEDLSISWQADKDEVVTTLAKQFQKGVEGRNDFKNFTFIKADDLTFAKRLFEATAINLSRYVQDVKSVTPNWDPERIGTVDLMIIAQCLEEILNFEDIPVRVSLNEYIELSKHYGTPKSKDFVNGVLDRLVKRYTEEGKINKTGRGLV
jgi:N utilization substance protein B